MTLPVAVVGGGFAGVAAACRLAGDGVPVVLLEQAARLGGRAGGFHDRTTGEDVDLGQHVSMRCCTATCGFLQRIGARDLICYQSRLSVPILIEGARAILRSEPLLPGPLHLFPALLAYRALSFPERLRILRAAGALLLGPRPSRPFGPWLRERAQTERTIGRLWDPVCVATLNAHVDDVDLRAARKVFRDGIFSPDGAGLGLFTAPLARIFDAARTYIEDRGGEVRCGSRVRALRTEGECVMGAELTSGDVVECAAAIAAVPPWDLAGLVPDGALRDILDGAGRLTWAPIVDVHLWLDRPVLDEAFAIAVDSPVQAIFDTDRIYGAPRKGRSKLVLSQSAVAPWIDRPIDEIAAELVTALADLLPAVREARLTRRWVTLHRRATFVPAPGIDSFRPSSKTPIGGFHLAGDWTATGWPATIEGAIRSGIAAAGRATIDDGSS